MAVYAYVHCKPDGTPFYVGKGALRRVKNLQRNAHHAAAVAKYGRDNIQIGMMECSSDDIACELERGLIKCLRRMGISLANYTDGGDGGGVNPCAETRERLSVAAKKRGVSVACQEARNAAKRGKPMSAEHKQKQREAMNGRVFSEEHRANISKGAKARGMSDAVRAACIAANTGRVRSEETRRKQKVAALAVWDARGRKVKVSKPRGSCWDTRETRSVRIDGVLYSSLKLASVSTGLSSSLISHALNGSGLAKGHAVQAGVVYGN